MANFRQYIGESPAGVTWIAYKPENVEPMRERLAVLHARAAARSAAPTASESPKPLPESPAKAMPSPDQEIVEEGPQGPVDLEALDRLRKLCAGRRSQNLWVGEDWLDGKPRVCTYRSRYEDSAKDVRSLVPAAGGTVQAFFKHGTMGKDMTNKPWVVRFTLGPAETAYVAREIGKRVLRDLLGKN